MADGVGSTSASSQRGWSRDIEIDYHLLPPLSTRGGFALDTENITLKYPGSINHFRSLMDGFIEHCNRYWKFSDNRFLTFEYRSDLHAGGREVWYVFLAVFENGELSRTAFEGATIYATEGKPDETTVAFLDGKHIYLSGHKQDFNDPGVTYPKEKLKIGEGLILFSKEIEKQWKSETIIALSLEKYQNKRMGRRGPNLDTSEKIRKLLQIREEAIRKHKDIPKWSTACNLAGIDHKTALHYLGELRPHWEDAAFQWIGK